MTPVSYGLWQRCEYNNITISKQGIAIGIRPVQVCYPNRYMRYAPEKYDTCDHIRRNCPVLQPADIPEGCSCRYLPSARCVQWLSILAAAFLTIGLLLLYLKTIASAQNGSFCIDARHIDLLPLLLLESAVLVLSFGPFVSFVLASFFMVTTLIMIGACKWMDTSPWTLVHFSFSRSRSSTRCLRRLFLSFDQSPERWQASPKF